MKQIAVILLLLAFAPLALSAQQQKMSPEEQEKKMYEAIQAQVDRLTLTLDLEDWQVFYVDSILTHDYNAMQAELTKLAQDKVSNTDLFYDVQDKWAEQIYNSMHGVLDEGQWNKYLKQGATRDKKAREKRAAKRQKQ